METWKYAVLSHQLFFKRYCHWLSLISIVSRRSCPALPVSWKSKTCEWTNQNEQQWAEALKKNDPNNLSSRFRQRAKLFWKAIKTFQFTTAQCLTIWLIRITWLLPTLKVIRFQPLKMWNKNQLPSRWDSQKKISYRCKTGASIEGDNYYKSFTYKSRYFNWSSKDMRDYKISSSNLVVGA